MMVTAFSPTTTAVEYVFCKMALGRVHPLKDDELTDPRFDGAMDISVAP